MSESRVSGWIRQRRDWHRLSYAQKYEVVKFVNAVRARDAMIEAIVEARRRWILAENAYYGALPVRDGWSVGPAFDSLPGTPPFPVQRRDNQPSQGA